LATRQLKKGDAVMSTNNDSRKRFWHFPAMMFAVPVLVALLLTDQPFGSRAMGLSAPSLSVPNVGYYCNAIFPNGGWSLNWSGNADGNANPCVGAYGATTVRTGSFLASGNNRIDLSCDGYSKVFAGIGTLPFSAAFQEASGKGNCLFTVTMGSVTP